MLITDESFSLVKSYDLTAAQAFFSLRDSAVQFQGAFTDFPVFYRHDDPSCASVLGDEGGAMFGSALLERTCQISLDIGYRYDVFCGYYFHA